MSGRAVLSLAKQRATPLTTPKAISRWSSTVSRIAEDEAPQPPRPIKDSTSAIDYKMHRPSRTLPHLVQQPHRSPTAEEAVTNILYNTPPPSTEPFKRHRLNCLVQNEPGVLSRVSGILAGRGFNIDSLVVCQTEIRDLSRMCIVLKGQDGVIEQARRQLEDLVPVWAVLDYTNTRCVERELLLAKVSTLGPEFLSSASSASDSPSGHPTDSPAYDAAIDGTASPPPFIAQDGSQTTPDAQAETREREEEQSFVRSFETSSQPHSSPLYPSRAQPGAMSPSEALIAKNLHFNAIKTLTEQFGGRVVDVGENDCIVQISAKSVRVNAFLNLMRTFGVIEAARSGVMVLPRTPIPNRDEEEEVSEKYEVDLSMLPPG